MGQPLAVIFIPVIAFGRGFSELMRATGEAAFSSKRGTRCLQSGYSPLDKEAYWNYVL